MKTFHPELWQTVNYFCTCFQQQILFAGIFIFHLFYFIHNSFRRSLITEALLSLHFRSASYSEALVLPSSCQIIYWGSRKRAIEWTCERCRECRSLLSSFLNFLLQSNFIWVLLFFSFFFFNFAAKFCTFIFLHFLFSINMFSKFDFLQQAFCSDLFFFFFATFVARIFRH